MFNNTGFDYRLLEEKKKQAEEFYKSDSDGEDTDDQEWTPDRDDEAAETEKEVNSSATTGKMDEQIETGELSLSTATEGKDESLGTKDELSSCLATQPLRDDILPDLAFPSESTQSMELQEGHSESLLLTDHAIISSEDEGIGTFEEMVQNDLSTSLNAAPSGDITDKQHSEGSSLMMECVIDRTEAFKNEGVEKDADAKSSCHKEDAATSDQMNTDSLELDECDTGMSTTNCNELQTPKLSLLASKLPEEEVKKIMSVTPRLSLGKEGDVIDLEETSTPGQKPGMDELINRFVRHSSLKRKPAKKHQVNLK